MRVLVTRPDPDVHATIERLGALGIEGVAAPVMSRQTLDFHLPPIEGFAALAVTSTNALRALGDRAAHEKLRQLPVYAVGDRTAHEARGLGYKEVYSAGGTFQLLSMQLALAKIDGPVLYPAGKHMSGDLAGTLAPHGVVVITVTTYDMVAETVLPASVLKEISSGSIEAALVYSRRSAQIFRDIVGDTLSRQEKSNLAMLCLSENVAQPLIEGHFTRVHLADRPDEEAMMSLALAFAREQSGP
jgi:uroporphyrinogen-III synthase